MALRRRAPLLMLLLLLFAATSLYSIEKKAAAALALPSLAREEASGGGGGPPASSSSSRLFRNQLVVMNEADLHCRLVVELRKTWPSALLVPGIGELPESGARRLEAWKMGYTRGQPDLMILNPSGEYHGLAVEFKHPGFEAAPTKDQLAFHSRLRSSGWKVLVCNDFSMALREIEKYLRECKVPCECCGRLFADQKRVDAHLARKRKREGEDDVSIAVKGGAS